VTVTTKTSVANGKYTEVQLRSGGSIIGGPYSERDLWVAAGGTAGGTGVGALLVVIIKQLGLHRGMERVA
jgi:hypothetical protein